MTTKIERFLHIVFFLAATSSFSGCNIDKAASPLEHKTNKAGAPIALQNPQNLLDYNLRLWISTKPAHYRNRLLIKCDCRFQTMHNPRRRKEGAALAFEYDEWLAVEILNDKLVSVTTEDGRPYDEYISAISQPYPSVFSEPWASSPDPIRFGFEVIQRAVQRNAESLLVDYDSKFGYPREITIDEKKAAVDDEFYMKIERFESL